MSVFLRNALALAILLSGHMFMNLASTDVKGDPVCVGVKGDKERILDFVVD